MMPPEDAVGETCAGCEDVIEDPDEVVIEMAGTDPLNPDEVPYCPLKCKFGESGGFSDGE